MGIFSSSSSKKKKQSINPDEKYSEYLGHIAKCNNQLIEVENARKNNQSATQYRKEQIAQKNLRTLNAVSLKINTIGNYLIILFQGGSEFSYASASITFKKLCQDYVSLIEQYNKVRGRSPILLVPPLLAKNALFSQIIDERAPVLMHDSKENPDEDLINISNDAIATDKSASDSSESIVQSTAFVTDGSDPELDQIIPNLRADSSQDESTTAVAFGRGSSGGTETSRSGAQDENQDRSVSQTASDDGREPLGETDALHFPTQEQSQKKWYTPIASFLPALGRCGKKVLGGLCVPFVWLASTSKNENVRLLPITHNNDTTSPRSPAYNSSISPSRAQSEEKPLTDIHKKNLIAYFIFKNRGVSSEEKEYIRLYARECMGEKKVLEKQNKKFKKQYSINKNKYDRELQDIATNEQDQYLAKDFAQWWEKRKQLTGAADTIQKVLEKALANQNQNINTNLHDIDVRVIQEEKDTLNRSNTFFLEKNNESLATVIQDDTSVLVRSDFSDDKGQNFKNSTTALFKDLITAYLDDIAAKRIEPEPNDQGFFVIRLSNKDPEALKRIMEFLHQKMAEQPNKLPVKVVLCKDATKPVSANNQQPVSDVIMDLQESINNMATQAMKKTSNLSSRMSL